MTYKEPSEASLNDWSIGSGCSEDDEGQTGTDVGYGLNQRN